MAHVAQDELVAQIKRAEGLIRVGGIYSHYKNPDNLYKVIGFGVVESNDEIAVLYQAQYGKKLVFVRPLTSWLERVERQGQKVPRFKII